MSERRRRRVIVLGLLTVGWALGAGGLMGQDLKTDRLVLFREIVGVYEAKVDGRPFFVTYYLENGQLRTVHADNAPVDCVPIPGEGLKFELAALSQPHPQLEFVRDANGKIATCRTRTGNRELLFIKRSGL